MTRDLSSEYHLSALAFVVLGIKFVGKAHGLRNEINEPSNLAAACSSDSCSKWYVCREEAIWYTLLKTTCFEKREIDERKQGLSNLSCYHCRYSRESLGTGSGLAGYSSARH